MRSEKHRGGKPRISHTIRYVFIYTCYLLPPTFSFGFSIYFLFFRVPVCSTLVFFSFSSLSLHFFLLSHRGDTRVPTSRSRYVKCNSENRYERARKVSDKKRGKLLCRAEKCVYTRACCFSLANQIATRAGQLRRNRTALSVISSNHLLCENDSKSIYLRNKFYLSNVYLMFVCRRNKITNHVLEKCFSKFFLKTFHDSNRKKLINFGAAHRLR